MWQYIGASILAIGLIGLGFTVYQIDDELKHRGMEGLFSPRKPKKSTCSPTTSGGNNPHPRNSGE
jgi:hypothetical protein